MVKYKSIRLLKFNLIFIKIYDYLRLKLKGEKIVSQDYSIITNQKTGKDIRYSLLKLIYTESMINDIKNLQKQDVCGELEKMLNIDEA